MTASHRGIGVLRLHFTSDDLSRVRFAGSPDPLWETVLSLTLLGTTQGSAVFDSWRARARTELRRLPRRQVRLLRHLVPAKGDFPDFLTPARASEGVDAGIEAVMATPRSRLRQEFAILPTAPSWTRPFADGDPAAMGELGASLAGYHRAVIAPHWPRMRALIDADRAAGARSLLDNGGVGMLTNLRPTARWRPPVLEVDYPVEHDIHLGGRGLLLVPSVFCWRVPVTLIDPTLPPVLVYPVTRGPDWWSGPGGGQGSKTLANLLGPTRAACLRVLEDGCTTTELARRTGVAPPTASQHASALREAGLVISTRHANMVLHTLTPLGTALLAANPRP